MRIKGFEIRGFGIFRDTGTDNMGKDLVVFTGNNETGKSTLMRFIKSCIFGMKGQKGPLDEPLNGGSHGGYMDVELEDGNSTRLVLDGRKLSEITDLSKEASSIEDGPPWIGISRDLYERVFSVGLDDLSKGGNRFLDEDSVKNRLFSATAGLGDISLKEVFSSLEREMKEIIKLRGNTSKTGLAELKRRIEGVDEELRQIGNTLEEYTSLQQKREELQKELEGLSRKVSDTRLELDRFDKLSKLSKPWNSFRILEKRKKELQWAQEFPPAGKERYMDLSRQAESLQENLKTQRKMVSEKKEELRSLELNPRILQVESEIESLRDERTLLSELPGKKAVLEEKLSTLKISLEEWSLKMGPSWSLDRMEKTDISGNAAREAFEFATEDEKTRYSVLSSEKILQDISKQVRATHRDLEKTEGTIYSFHEDITEGDELGLLLERIESTKEKVRALFALEEKKAYFEKLYDQTSKDIEEEREKTEDLRLTFPLPLTLVFFLLMCGGIALFLVFFPPSIFSSAILIASILPFPITALVDLRDHLRNSRRRERAEYMISIYKGKAGELLEEIDLCNDALHLSGEELDRILEDTGVVWEKGSSDMQEIMDAMERRKKSLQELEKVIQRRDRLREDLEVLEEKEISAGEELKESEAIHEKMLQRWKDWLLKHQLPEDTEPGGFPRLEQAVTAIRRIQISMDEVSREIERTEELLREKNRELDRLLAESGLEGSCGEPSAKLDMLVTALSGNRKILGSRKALEETVWHMEARIREEEESLSGILTKISALLENAGCSEEEEFFRMYEDFCDLRKVQEESTRTWSEMTGIAGGQNCLDALLRELEELDVAYISEKVLTLEEDLTKARGKYDTVQKELGAVENRIEEMSSDTRQSLLFQQREILLSEASRLSKKWVGLGLSRYLIQQSMEKYEKEKQPEVVKLASRYMGIITSGRYELLLSAEDNRIMLNDLFRKERKEKQQWSSGLADQAYICIRLALATVLSSMSEPVPIVLDDIHLRFDPWRQKGMARVILDLAKKQQIILFSCNPEFSRILHSLSQASEKDSIFYSLCEGELKQVNP